MIKAVIFLAILYLVIHSLILFKNNNKNDNQNKSRFKVPNKDKIKDADFEDAE